MAFTFARENITEKLFISKAKSRYLERFALYLKVQWEQFVTTVS